MNTTKIVWTEKTWNPVSGCQAVSSECKHCYARTLAERYRGTAAFPAGFDLTFRPHKLDEPRRLTEPSLIFVNSMSDLFLDGIPDGYRDRVLAVIAATPRHTFQTLTKRPEAAERYFAARRVPPNLWLGVSCGGPEWSGRIDVLRRIDVAVRFVSIEPMLAPFDAIDLEGVGWVIVGGESGLHLCDPAVCAGRGLVRRTSQGWEPREDRMPWVRGVRDMCAASGVPFLFKQWGGSKGELAGRTLDGEIHDAYPR